MERSCRSHRLLSLLLAGPLPETRVMIYSGFGSALGARELSEHIPCGVSAGEKATCNSQLHTLGHGGT